MGTGIIVAVVVVAVIWTWYAIARGRAEKRAGRVATELGVGLYKDGTVRQRWGKTVIGELAGSRADIVSEVHNRRNGKTDITVAIKFANGASHTKRYRQQGDITSWATGKEIDRYNTAAAAAA